MNENGTVNANYSLYQTVSPDRIENDQLSLEKRAMFLIEHDEHDLPVSYATRFG